MIIGLKKSNWANFSSGVKISEPQKKEWVNKMLDNGIRYFQKKPKKKEIYSFIGSGDTLVQIFLYKNNIDFFDMKILISDSNGYKVYEDFDVNFLNK